MLSRSSLRLNQHTYHAGLAFLSEQDEDLARILILFGIPPIWERDPGFPTLVQIILEQQVSLASAQAAFHRLQRAVSPLEPEGFLGLDDESLRIIGFSRQKTRYCRELAISIISGQLNLEALEAMDDASVRKILVSQIGIGSWTAEIYLLMALLRSDAWPAQDLALIKAIRELKNLPGMPADEQIKEISSPWRPYRAVAARMLWHYYLRGED